LTRDDKKKYCSGCHDDIYNGSMAPECWSLDRAELVMKKEVHIDQVPPWNQKPKKVLSCYHKPRFVYVDPDRTC
jgi:hypothetical protein